ncbi:MAG TPA: MFS transporter [Candidatus Limnocylindrales bacterium]|nr:MFS transporter [Candidatus Limnocylindrales bacterium]
MPDEITAEELIHPESLPSAHVPPRVPGEDGLWSPARRPLTLGLVLTITLVAAEALAVSTAMPIVAKDLGGLELYGLVFSAFLIGSLFGIVVVGGLIDRRGVVLPFVIGLVLFAIGLAIGGFAPSMPVLIAARFVQGIGGGTIPPVAYVAIGRSLPESLRPRMFAMLSTAWILPGVLGPAIAGIVAEVFHWRWIFLGLLPLIVLSGTMALRGLRPLPRIPATGAGSSLQRLADALVVAAGAALVTAGLSSETPVLLVGLTAAGVLLIGIAFRRLTPPGTLSAARGYPTAVLLRGVLTLSFFCVDAYVALLLVEVRGWSAAEAGIALTAATISWTAGSWTQARLSTRFPPERFVRVGFPIVAIGIAGLGLILVPGVPAVLAVPIFAFCGLGMGLTYAQFALIVLRDVPSAIQGTVTAGLTLSDVIGTALGTGIAAAAVSTAVRQGEGPGPGIGIAIAVGAVVAMVGFLLSPRLRLREDPVTSRAREAGSAGGLG